VQYNILPSDIPPIVFSALVSEDINTFAAHVRQFDSETLQKIIGISLLAIVDHHPALLVYAKLKLINEILIERIESNSIRLSELEHKNRLKADLKFYQTEIVTLKQEAIDEIKKLIQDHPAVKSGNFKLDLAILFSEDINKFNKHIVSFSTNDASLTINNLICAHNILLRAGDKHPELLVKAKILTIYDQVLEYCQMSEGTSAKNPCETLAISCKHNSAIYRQDVNSLIQKDVNAIAQQLAQTIAQKVVQRTQLALQQELEENPFSCLYDDDLQDLSTDVPRAPSAGVECNEFFGTDDHHVNYWPTSDMTIEILDDPHNQEVEEEFNSFGDDLMTFSYETPEGIYGRTYGTTGTFGRPNISNNQNNSEQTPPVPDNKINANLI
jgi:hypothetical protein